MHRWRSEVERAGLVAFVFSMLLACAPATPQETPKPAPRWVYLAPADGMGRQHRPFTVDDWRRAGVVVVTRFADLRAQVGPETEAIVVDADGLAQVDVDWLWAQSRPPQPKGIVAVNLNLRELQELLDEPQPWTESWKPADAHFALVTWGHGCHSAGQERFAVWTRNGLPTFLKAWVLPYTECTQRS